MIFLKISITLLLMSFEVAFAQSDLDRYYSLEREVASLSAENEDIQRLINKYSTSADRLGSPTSVKRVLERLNRQQDNVFQKIKSKTEEMKSLEQNLEVQAWDQRFGILFRVNAVLGDVVRSTNCPTQGRQLFTSDKAFEAWSAQNSRMDSKVAYYASKNEHINNCLESTDNETEKDVSYTGQFACKKPDSYFENPVSYQLSKENDQIVVSTKLSFNYKGSPENKLKSIRAMKNTLPCMKDFYARHGIKLNISFQFDNESATGQSCDHYLNLWDEKSSANAMNWVSHKSHDLDIGVDDEPKNRCSLALHELGHLLGLGDSYPSPDCPDQRVGANDDIMRSGSFIKPENVKISDSDIKKILSPVCGE